MSAGRKVLLSSLPGELVLGRGIADKLMGWPWETARCDASGAGFALCLGSAGADYQSDVEDGDFSGLAACWNEPQLHSLGTYKEPAALFLLTWLNWSFQNTPGGIFLPLSWVVLVSPTCHFCPSLEFIPSQLSALYGVAKKTGISSSVCFK